METIDLGLLEIGKQIGEGGFGTVHEANFKNIGHRVAVKLLNPSSFQGPGAAQRFINEAKILLSLRHPHIISVYGFGIHEDKPYIIMERFDGMDLHKVGEKKGRPSPNVVIPFIRRCANALGHAHSMNIIHRDVKPTNLMTAKGDCRVIDFGIGKIIDPDGERFTKTGRSPIGGVFTAPELLEDHRILDPICDVYSLGACWFWLLTGHAPNGHNWEAALTATEVSTEYASVILKSLAQKEKRFSSMEELAYELDALEKGRSTSTHLQQCEDDDSLTVLGILFEQDESDDRGVSFYAIDKQINQHMSRFRLKLSLKRLESAHLVAKRDIAEWNSTYIGYFLTEEGEKYIGRHQKRIEDLLSKLAPGNVMEQTHQSDDDLLF